MLTKTSTNPALQAYRVYHLSQRKLDTECRRGTPDLHRLVVHASIVENVRRWSREITEPAETILVESDSDADSDPFEDSASDDEFEDVVAAGEVAIFDCEVDDDAQIVVPESESKTLEIGTGVVQHVEDKTKSSVPKPKRHPPPPPTATSTYEFKDQSCWRQSRPVLVRETAIEVGEDD